jgi:hypothetical protein
VDIVVNPVPTATFTPAPTETVVRTNYTLDNNDYRLYGSPAAGVFSGQGVTKKADGNYYFNPLNAGVGTWPIVYTFTNGFGCADTDTRNFTVSASAVDGLELSYCRNRDTDTGLRYNVANFPAGFQFTRLVFYSFDNNTFSVCLGETAPNFPYCGGPNPLTVTSTTNVVDIQTGLTVSQPVNYSLDIAMIRNSYGYSVDHSFYILVYGKNALGQETFRTYQYFEVLDNGPVPAVVGINEGQNICSSLNPIELSASELGYSVTNFTVSPGTFSGSLSGGNNRFFDPEHASLFGAPAERLLTLTMNYTDYNNCPNTTTRSFNWVKKPDAPIAPDVSYCQITSGGPQSFVINASPAAGGGAGSNPYWYELDPASNPTTPVLDSINFSGFIAPGITGLTPIVKTFYVTENYKSCEGATAAVDIEIKDAPDATITREPICEARDFVAKGPKDGAVPYTKYEWTFGDGQSQTVLGVDSVVHNYGPGSGSSPFTIGLTVTNSLGCINTDTDAITVGLNPKPKFTYNFVCDDDVTQFHATTDIAVSQYKWEFNDASPIVGPGPFQNTTHQFASGVGTYKTKLTTFTAQGCFNSDSTNITILSYISHSSALPYDMDELDGGKGFWTLEDLRDSTTWTFGTPNKTIIQAAFPTWVTNPTGNYKANDASVLNSPCLDITGFNKPVISLDFIANTQQKFDGAVLEYSVNGGVTWKALGAPGTGQNWFNTTGFFSGKIGDSQVGWSGDLMEQTNGWLTAKRALDDEITVADRDKVRFRIAFGSNGDAEYEGFAFTNLTITERNRVMLLENFTNESDPQYGANNTTFKNLSSTELVKLQYNLSFPGADPVSSDNEADPNARAAYYGITNDALIIPRVYIDGQSEGNLITPWFTNFAALRSLSYAPFSISINTTPADPGDLTVEVSATALQNITSLGFIKPILHVAIVEKTVGGNVSVLRKLLPDAAGTEIPLPVAKDAVIDFDPLTWSVTTSDPADLAIVAFIQDEVTKEVYQAEYLAAPANLPGIVTGNEPTLADLTAIYPNPANDKLIIELPERAKQNVQISLVDTYGRSIITTTIEKGRNGKIIETSNLTPGLYFMRINTDHVRKKILIVH